MCSMYNLESDFFAILFTESQQLTDLDLFMCFLGPIAYVYMHMIAASGVRAKEQRIGFALSWVFFLQV